MQTKSKNKQIYQEQPNHSSKKMNVCLSVIKKSKQQKRTKAIATYYFLKATYRNSCIFRYKSRMKAIAEQIGICEKTLHNYINHLRRLELASDHCGNLILGSTKKVKGEANERKKYQITITKQDTLKDIEARLFAKIVELQCNKIAFHRALRKFEKRQFSRDSDKKTCNANDKTSISARNLQKLFCLSQLKTKQVLDTMNELGVIKTTKRNPQIVGYGLPESSLKYSREFPGHIYIRDKFVFMRFGDYHECLEYPVQVRELSYKRYIKFKKTETCKN